MSDKYLTMAILVVVTACIPYFIAYKQRPKYHMAAVLFIMLLLTSIFDPLIIGADIVRYYQDSILGVTLFGAPIEDFSYAVAAAILIPFLWVVISRGKL